MANKKYYAVAAGRSRGIYSDWATTEKLVKGFAGAKYKSFSTRQEAEAWLQEPVYQVKERQTGRQAKPTAASPGDEGDPGAITVYTDGGCINNPGPGGYGVVIASDGRRRELSEGFRHTTNNRMEMMAAIVALRELRRCGKKVVLTSDSSYLVNGIGKGWAKKWRSRGWRKSDGLPVLNVDLWQELLGLLDEVEVQFNWVKGHAGNELNERCDQLAVAAARHRATIADVIYETIGNGADSRDQRTV